MPDFFPYLRPFIHALPPEAAHNAALRALAAGLVSTPAPVDAPMLSVDALGLRFANPVGLAAGFDKNAVAIDALLRQGFGFVETGTVTPLPQPGNDKPRIFRLEQDRAVINRLGFNNRGLAHYVNHFTRRDPRLGIAGANIGRNKSSEDATLDYITGLIGVYPIADYVTINISSPNTQGLRALQEKQALDELLGALKNTRDACAHIHKKYTPLLLKIAPDLENAELEAIADVVTRHGFDGLIVSNTTLARPASLVSANAGQAGGLSGAPLFGPSTQRLKQMYRIVGKQLPLIGVGGIASPEDAYCKIRAGATLVQLYSALTYQGFGLVRAICKQLPALLQRDGFTHISQAIGVDA